MIRHELELNPLEVHDGYRVIVSDSEQFNGTVQDFDVWRNNQHLRTFESEQAARGFIDHAIGKAYSYVSDIFCPPTPPQDATNGNQA